MSKNKNSGLGLGRGLDSLIPNDYYDEDFDANSTQSLEDMLNDSNNKDSTIINNYIDDDSNVEDVQHEEDKSSDVSKDDKEEKPVEDQIQKENDDDKDIIVDSSVQSNIDEVMEIVHKNPRITLWSVHSSAVFRYLRKTQPEFSISNEASSLIDEAVSKKYPEIWKLFEDKI
ncbi:hypothetical protein [uncultured Methanobrevibacter sp.]|uniref:hypothetical protein n=1 Tax=uncultured Methanobrevibacter sp. TaxID=253161 RepID=UPI0025D63C0D|nr:hypothetical protein [uncultured Methanobrevibacter sp.]